MGDEPEGFIPNPMRSVTDWFGKKSPLKQTSGWSDLTEANGQCDNFFAFFNREAAEFRRLGELEAKVERTPDEEAEAEELREFLLGDPRLVLPGRVLAIHEAEAQYLAEGFRRSKEILNDGAAALGGWDMENSIRAAEAMGPKGTVRMDQSPGGGPR